MAGARQRRFGTREDFLRWEADQPERWEFLDGVIEAIAGGTVAHNRVTGRIFRMLAPAAERRGCEAFQQNQKLTPEHSDATVYPDVFVTCRPVSPGQETVPGATVVVEVSSRSTREDDYRWKWELYQGMPELRHYLVVDPESARITHYHRPDAGDEWRIQLIVGREASVNLAALDLILPLADIYADVGTGPGQAG